MLKNLPIGSLAKPKNAPCPRCGDAGVIVLPPPALLAKRCLCDAGMRPGLYVGPIHAEDWIAVFGQNIGGENVAKTA